MPKWTRRAHTSRQMTPWEYRALADLTDALAKKATPPTPDVFVYDPQGRLVRVLDGRTKRPKPIPRRKE